jgi:UPF0271 protein
MAVHGTVIALDGSEVPCPISSIRLPGDGPGALGRARRIHAALTVAGLHPVSFARPRHAAA